MRGLWGEAHFCGWTELCLLAGKVESGQEEAPAAVKYADLAKAGSPEGVRFRVPRRPSALVQPAPHGWAPPCRAMVLVEQLWLRSRTHLAFGSQLPSVHALSCLDLRFFFLRMERITTYLGGAHQAPKG